MNQKILRKAQITNLFVWIFAIVFPIIAPAFASKEPKIFEIMMPGFQLMCAYTSNIILSGLFKTIANEKNSDDQTS